MCNIVYKLIVYSFFRHILSLIFNKMKSIKIYKCKYYSTLISSMYSEYSARSNNLFKFYLTFYNTTSENRRCRFFE